MISYHLLSFNMIAPTSIVSWFFKVQRGEGIRMPGFSMIFSCRLWRNNSLYSEAVYYVTRSLLDQVLLRIFVSTLTFASVNEVLLCYHSKKPLYQTLSVHGAIYLLGFHQKKIWTFAFFFLINQFDGEGKYSKHFITTDTDKSSWECCKCTTASLLYVKRRKFSHRKDNKTEFKSSSLFCCDCNTLSRVRSISFRPYI